MTRQPHPSPRALLAAAAVIVTLVVGCHSTPEQPRSEQSRSVPSDPAGTSTGDATATATAARPQPTPDEPPLPNTQDVTNGTPLGAGILTYTSNQPRDWADIDRWYRSTGRSRHQFTGEPRIHRVIAGNRNPNPPQLDLDTLLMSHIVLENNPAAPDGVYVMAHHNVTRLHSGAVNHNGTTHNQPLMGIHAPHMPGDTFTWLIPHDDKTAAYEFRALAIEIIPDALGEYDKLFAPLQSGKPLLVTYQCHPAGSLRQRRVVRHELVAKRWVDDTITWVD